MIYIWTHAVDSSHDVLRLASGTELLLAVEAYEQLTVEGIRARVVSLPSWDLFEQQDQAYRDTVLPPQVKARAAIEQASNTVPPATLAAFLDHSVVRADSLQDDLPGAYQAMARLEASGISMDNVTAELEAEGVKSFGNAWTALLGAMEASRKAAVGEEWHQPVFDRGEVCPQNSN